MSKMPKKIVRRAGKIYYRFNCQSGKRKIGSGDWAADNRNSSYYSRVLQRRTKNNPVLIGEPGVGKTAIVESGATYYEWRSAGRLKTNIIFVIARIWAH